MLLQLPLLRDFTLLRDSPLDIIFILKIAGLSSHSKSFDEVHNALRTDGHDDFHQI